MSNFIMLAIVAVFVLGSVLGNWLAHYRIRREFAKSIANAKPVEYQPTVYQGPPMPATYSVWLDSPLEFEANTASGKKLRIEMFEDKTGRVLIDGKELNKVHMVSINIKPLFASVTVTQMANEVPEEWRSDYAEAGSNE